mgnify:CR=1 FL=1
MIKVTLNDILNNNETFRGIYEKPMSARTAFKVARLIRELEKENNTFDKSRIDIIMKYAERDEEGNVIEGNGQVQIAPEYLDDFHNELNDLLNTEITVNAEKLSVEDFDNMQLTPKQILDLEKFIEE